MIQIYNGTLTSKERVLRTFNHEKADRVPIGYFANPGIQKRVAAALGVPADKDSVNDALGVDFKGLMPAWIADEKSPARISHRSFATKSLRNGGKCENP